MKVDFLEVELLKEHFDLLICSIIVIHHVIKNVNTRITIYNVYTLNLQRMT